MAASSSWRRGSTAGRSRAVRARRRSRNSGRASLVPSLPPGHTVVSIGATDWRVMVAVSAAPTLAAARPGLGMTRFVMARSIASLVRAGVLVVAPVS